MASKNLYKAILLRRMYEGLTDEEKAVINDARHKEIMDSLTMQQKQLQDIRKSNFWLKDFSANLSANAVWDGLVWVGSKLIKKL